MRLRETKILTSMAVWMRECNCFPRRLNIVTRSSIPVAYVIESYITSDVKFDGPIAHLKL